MILEILKHTPPWVYVLFVALLAVGYLRSKPRTVSRVRVAILPLVMISLSLYGVLSAFGVSVTALGGWVAGIAVAVGAGLSLGIGRGAGYSAATDSISVPGSWLPFALMMAIFFTKFAVAVALARKLPLAASAGFVTGISFTYGMLSGLFFASALAIWRTVKRAGKVPDP